VGEISHPELLESSQHHLSCPIRKGRQTVAESWPPGIPATASTIDDRQKLSTVQLRRIEQELKRGPETVRYVTSFWAAPRVAELIERECDIQYHPEHVWKILQQMGWSCQRPAVGGCWNGAKPLNITPETKTGTVTPQTKAPSKPAAKPLSKSRTPTFDSLPKEH
jgi:Winged helix-turn helix